MNSTFGKNIKITIDGGSHEASIGVKIDGLEAFLAGQAIEDCIDFDKLQAFMNRRAPGNSKYATKRKEPDIPIKEDDHPLHFIIKNTDQHSGDYKNVRHVPRPGHADFTAYMKYGDSLNMAGGGPFSARMTAPLCIAGGIALQLLEKRGITIGAHMESIGPHHDDRYPPTMETLPNVTDPAFAVLNQDVIPAMQQTIEDAMADLDSVGGVVEVAALGLPVGLGGPMYDDVEGRLAEIFFGIPAVKGLEFGDGFGATTLRGSENNDAFVVKDGHVVTATNHHGGILGGITTGMPLIARLAFKPTPSISREQDSVDLETMTPTKLVIKGRHDPCVVVRAVPIVEAAMAIGILDLLAEA